MFIFVARTTVRQDGRGWLTDQQPSTYGGIFRDKFLGDFAGRIIGVSDTEDDLEAIEGPLLEESAFEVLAESVI
jgi:hypothetical protein